MPENIWKGMTGWPSNCQQRTELQNKFIETQDALCQQKPCFGLFLPIRLRIFSYKIWANLNIPTRIKIE